MLSHVALLRAVNVGDRRMTMQELRDAFAPLGFGDVATWQATGNVVFACEEEATDADLEGRIVPVLAEQLGLDVPVVVRTADRVLEIVAQVPFTTDQVDATEGRVQILFVRDEPTPEALAVVLSHATDEDELAWDGRELWWLPRAGVSDSRLPVRRLEDELGVATMRTHRAVAGLAAKYLGW